MRLRTMDLPMMPTPMNAILFIDFSSVV